MISKARKQEAIIKKYRHAQALLNAIKCEAIEIGLELPTVSNSAERRAVSVDNNVNGRGVGGDSVEQRGVPGDDDDDDVNGLGVGGVDVVQRIVPTGHSNFPKQESLLQSTYSENNDYLVQHVQQQYGHSARVQQSIHWESNHVHGRGLGGQRGESGDNLNNYYNNSARYWRRRYYQLIKNREAEGYHGSGRGYRGGGGFASKIINIYCQ
ncbi:hypothetical protein HCN44_009845 [Aphidius gifuensis]|uniref:Uncharacterized protein n=2 Tax=Aphidius gifuensis TaxID=684658 RepID=A0A834XYS8_APHGI|nr:hypothetical protein HCN44_009845 [Aphidius gifuensis]